MLHLSRTHQLCHYAAHRQAILLCAAASMKTPLKHSANKIMLTKREGRKEALPHSKGGLSKKKQA